MLCKGSVKNMTCTELGKAFTFLIEYMYNLMTCYHISTDNWNSYGRKMCCLTYRGSVLVSLSEVFMSNLHKSKRTYRHVYVTTRYLDDIFTVHNPAFQKNIPE